MTPWMTSTRFSGVTVERISCSASARKLRSVDVSCVQGNPSMRGNCKLCQRAGRSATRCRCSLRLFHLQFLRLTICKGLHRVWMSQFGWAPDAGLATGVQAPASGSVACRVATHRVVVCNVAVIEHQLGTCCYIPARAAARLHQCAIEHLVLPAAAPSARADAGLAAGCSISAAATGCIGRQRSSLSSLSATDGRPDSRPRARNRSPRARSMSGDA